MGTLTRTQVISEGLLLAGRDEYSTAAQGWLQRWLDSVAQSWDWPLLRKEYLGYAIDPSLANSAGQQFGIGGTASTGPATRVLDIYDNVWLYKADGSVQQRVQLQRFTRQPKDKLAVDGQGKGMPNLLLAELDGFGKYRFFLTPEADRTDYLLSVPYKELPAALASDSDVPWFPVDEVLVQAVCFKALEYVDGKDADSTIAAQQTLAGLLSEARVRHAGQSPDGDRLMLDRAIFRHRTL